MAQPDGPAVPVTYATHAAPGAAGVLSHVVDQLAQQLPLSNVHWRPAAPPAPAPAPTLRMLPTLPVRLVSLGAHSSHGNTPVLQRMPVAHLFFVSCDDSDAYRTQVRNEVRSWIATLPTHVPADYPDTIAVTPEYLIVVLPTSSTAASAASAKGPMGRFYPMHKSSVLEKLRADFNSSTSERVVSLARIPSGGDPAVWADLLGRLKECAATSITQLLELQERDVLAYDTSSPWTYCGAFLRSERLIGTLETLDLLEDALARYDALQTRLLRRDARVAFSAPGGAAQGDDSLLLLGPLRKPYAELIARGTISHFDMLCYLYARRAMLLGSLGDVVAVMQMTPAFISHVACVLRPHRGRLARVFVEAWSFSVALDAVEQCQAWLVEQGDADDARTSRAFHAAKAELLELAMRQLVSVGMQTGHLPRVEPFAFMGDAAPVAPADVHITRKELVEAVAGRDVFDSQLRNLVHRGVLAASLCQQAPRAQRLRYVLSCVEMARGAHAEASRLLDEVLDAQHAWDPLLAFAHAKRLACLRALRLDQGERWVAALVGALQVVCAARFYTPACAELDESTLLRALQASSAQDTLLVAYNGVRVCLGQVCAARESDDDGASMAVDLVSYVREPLQADSVHLYAHNSATTLCFASGPLELRPGAATHARLYCATPATGFFDVQSTQVRVGCIVFESVVQRPALPLDAEQYEYVRPRVFVPADGDAADVRLCAPPAVQLDGTQCVVMEVDSGRNELDARVVLEAASGVAWSREPLRLETPAVTLEGSEPSRMDTSETRAFALRGVPPHTQCRVAVPLARMLRDARVTLIATMRYTTRQSHPDVERTLERTLSVSLALPLSLNIQDYFRLDRLFSKLAVDASAPVRVCAPTLKAPAESALRVTVPPSAAPCVLHAHETSTYLLGFERMAARRVDHAPCLLRMAYRSLASEAQGAALRAVAAAMGAVHASWTRGDVSLLQRAVCDAVARDGSGVSWAADAPYWRACVERWGWSNAQAQQLAELLERVLQQPIGDAEGATQTSGDAPAPSHPPSGAAYDPAQWLRAAGAAREAWQTISLPLDVPFVDAVNAVTVHVPHTHVACGAPVDVRMDIQTSFAWGQRASGAVHLQYIILGDYESWIVWGGKKGVLIADAAQDTVHHTIHATLVPVRTGALLLPRVRLAPVPPTTRPFRCETYMTNAVQSIGVARAPAQDTYWVDVRA